MAGSQRSRRAGFLAVAALTTLAVAGCGSVTEATAGSRPATGTSGAGTSRAGTSGAGTSAPSASGASAIRPARPYLCAHPGATRQVIITQAGTLRILEGRRPAQPAGRRPASGSRPVLVRMVTSRAQVHALARALCGLPWMPHGPLPCPALFLGSYQFYFTASGRRLPAVVVQPTGCREVTGLGPVRRAGPPAFWRLLNRILGRLPGLARAEITQLRPARWPGPAGIGTAHRLRATARTAAAGLPLLAAGLPPC